MFSPCALCGEDVASGRGALGHGGYVHGDPAECPVQTEMLKKRQAEGGFKFKISAEDGESFVDVNPAPMPPPPPGDPELPAPSETELDDLFSDIDEAILGHPYFVAARMAMQGLDNYTKRHHALLDVLIKSNVLPDTAHVAFEAALAARVAEADLEAFRGVVTAAAKGAIRVSGSPIPPDDVSALFTALFGADPHPAEIVRAVVKHSFDAKRVTHFYHHLREDPETGLFEKLLSYVKNERERADEAEEESEESEDADFDAAVEEARLRAEEQKRNRQARREQAEIKLAALKAPKSQQERVDALSAQSSVLLAAVIALKREMTTPGAPPNERLVTRINVLEVSHELLRKDISELKSKIKPVVGDSPFCPKCGHAMTRTGNAALCPSCGYNMDLS